jgi:hypothetical protein
VIDTIWNLLFRCQHRRTTFPLTPARSKKGADSGEKHADTYVVCLDCGKQFVYDWENMRLGGAADIAEEAPRYGPAPQPPPHKVPFRTKSKMRYLLWGSALSAAVVLGKAAQSRRRSRGAAKKDAESDHDKDAQTPRSSQTQATNRGPDAG